MDGARAVRGPNAVWACVGGACIVAGASAVGACQKDPVITQRSVTLHAPQACAPGLASLSADAGAFAVYHALGDYEPAPPVDGHLVAMETTLPEIDPAARALLVDTTEQDREWQGVSPIAPTGGVDVLLLPATTPCALRGTVGGTGATIGIAGQQALIVSGSSGAGASGTAVFQLDTGEVDALPASLASVRTGSTVTPFGTAALVAGGISASGVLGEADVYDPASGGFESPSIALSAPRYAAGAAVLGTGETLLVGGIGDDRMTALDSIEIVDPVTRKARPAPSRLAAARSEPTVLRLASGEIFVAGGVDSNRAPVTKLEWFSSDLSQAITSRTEDLVAGSARAYAALEGGGVLAVVAPPMNAPASFQNVWVIDPDGVPEPAPPIEGPTPQPVLFGGAGGAPVLWTGTATGVPGRWLRWQPWVGAFAALEVLDDTPGRVMGPGASPDPGTALWLDTTTATARLAALRFDVRGEYSTLSGPLLVSDTTDMVPDRLPTDGLLSFDPGAGHLTLDPGTTPPGASAFVSDRTYADVRIELDAPTGQPALVVLRDALGDEMEVGGAACAGTVVTGAASTLTVERKGANITWTIAGGASGKCTLGFDADARVSVGVRAAPDLVQSVVTNLRVTRLGTP